MRRTLATLVPLALLLAACGGDDDETSGTTDTTDTTAAPTAPTTTPDTTAPSTTAPATTVPPTTVAATVPSSTTAAPFDDVTIVETVDIAGFASVGLADGWAVREQADSLTTWFEDVPGLEWEPDPDSIETLLAIERDSGQTFVVYRESRYGLVDDVFGWDRAVGDLLGISPNVDVTTEWGGGRGESTRGTQTRDGETVFVRHESVGVGDQLVGALAVSDEQPTEQLDHEITVMLDSIEFDLDVVPLLNHTLNTKVTVSAENTGGTPFEYSVLAPPPWVDDVENSLVFRPRDPDQDGYIEYFAELATSPFADSVQAEMDRAGTDWLDTDPVVEETEIDGHEAVIVWEGTPDAATAAIVFVTDGVVFAGSYLWTPGNAALLQAMVESAIVPESAIAG